MEIKNEKRKQKEAKNWVSLKYKVILKIEENTEVEPVGVSTGEVASSTKRDQSSCELDDWWMF